MPALSLNQAEHILRPMLARVAAKAFPPTHTVWEHHDPDGTLLGLLIYRAADGGTTPVVVWFGTSKGKLFLTLDLQIGQGKRSIFSVEATSDLNFEELERKFYLALSFF